MKKKIRNLETEQCIHSNLQKSLEETIPIRIQETKESSEEFTQNPMQRDKYTNNMCYLEICRQRDFNVNQVDIPKEQN